MRIALVELNIEWENKKANFDKLENIISSISEEKADLLLLPEMSFTGFSMNVAKTKDSDMETVDHIKDLSCKTEMAIGAGWVKEGDKLCENHYSIIYGNEQLLDYVKIHPFSYSKEDNFFMGGNKISYCKYKDFDIGVQICYDLRFPEPFQALSKSTSLIIVPANWPQKRREHWNTLLKARAIENQVYIAGINCAGEIGGLMYSGDSQLINPNGDICNAKVIEVGSSDKVLIYDIKNDVPSYRDSFPTKDDRKEQLYIKFYENL